VSAFKTYHSSLKANGTVGGVLIRYFYPEYLDNESSELPSSEAEGGNLNK
jgi:hypothetical protein